MVNKLIKRLLVIANIGLLIAGAIFLGISIFSETKDTTNLAVALGCIIMANVFNLIKTNIDKKDR